MSRTAVVAYSGGLDTSCILAWLKEEWYGFDEVVAVLVDVGQEFDLEESIARAKAAGADDILLVDRKDAFADEQCARAILTNALYEGKYPLVSALSRPVIAQAVAEIKVFPLHNGDAAARDQLVTLVYGELRRMAHRRLQLERNGHTMRTGTLAHEVYLRLIPQSDATWEDRGRFVAIAAHLMRQVLVDSARDRIDRAALFGCLGRAA